MKFPKLPNWPDMEKNRQDKTTQIELNNQPHHSNSSSGGSTGSSSYINEKRAVNTGIIMEDSIKL